MDKTKLFSAAEKAVLKNQIDKAVEFLEKIIQADPNDIKALNKTADLYLKQSRQSEAIEILRKIGHLYTKDGFISKAVAIYKRILKIEDDSADKHSTIKTHESLATLYSQLGLVSDAMNHFKLVVDYYDQTQDKDSLLQVLRKVSDLDPGNVDSQLKLAELFAAEGNEGDARETFSRLAENVTGSQHLPDLIAVYEKWHQAFPSQLEPLEKLIETYISGGEPKKALARLQTAFRQDPYNAQILELLSSTFRQMRQADKAKAVDVELIKIYRKNDDQEKLIEVETRLKSSAGPQFSTSSSQANHSTESTRVATSGPDLNPLADDHLDPAESLIKRENLSNEERKVVSECDVYLKYGLAEKAREVLNMQMQNFPKSLPLRWRLKAVLVELKLNEEAEQALSEMILLSKDQNDQSWLKVAAKELSAMNPRHDSLVGVSGLQDHHSEPAASPQGGDEVSQIDLEQGLDDSEISIVVEDDFLSSEHEKPDFLDLEDLEPSGAIELEQPLELIGGSMPDESAASNEIEDFLDEQQQQMAQKVELFDQGELSSVDSPDDALALDEVSLEVSGDQGGGAEFLLTEDDFSEDELKELSNAIGPEASSSGGSDVLLDAFEESGAHDAKALVEDSNFEIRQGIEEVAFFRSQGLREEADELLASLKQKFPEHQNWHIPEASEESGFESLSGDESLDLILEDSSISFSDSVVSAEGDNRAVELEALGAKVKLQVQEDSRADEEDDFFDLAAELESELEEEKPALAPEVSGVLDAFKKGVSQSVSTDDFQTHYDLGIAYREMGLVHEAIEEFKLCAAIDGKEATSLYQVGLCYAELGRLSEAKESFEKALAQSNIQEAEMISLNYELAEIFLSLDEKTQAKRLFQEVQKMDPEFRETQEKLQQLG